MIILLELLLFLFSSIIGTLGHYLYKLSGNNSLVGFLFARNESTFEHLKLGITPILILSIVEKVRLLNNNLLSIKGIQILIFSLIIIVFYYGRKLFFKKNNAIYNITLFYIALFVSYVISFIMINMISIPITIKIIGIVSILLFVFLYFYSSIFELNCFIFKDPLDQSKD